VPAGEGTGVVTATGGLSLGGKRTRGWRSPAHVLQAVFDVRPDEGRTVALLVALTLCVQAGTGVGSSSLQALFFARLGVQLLPAMYVVLGVVTFLFTLGVAVLLSRTIPIRVHGRLPLALAAILVAARVLLLLDVIWVYPVLWVLASVMVTAQGVFTWGLAGAVCDARQAKRLFPLINAGGILGAVAGGLATPQLAARLGADNLVLVWVVGYGLAFVLGRAVRGLAPQLPGGLTAKPAHPVREMLAGYQVIRRSALLSWMALAVATYFVLVYLLAFPFSAQVTSEFPGADELAGFLGVFQGAFTGVAFLSSIFLGNRLFARFGIMSVLLGFAVVCLIGFGALVIYAVFPVLVGFRFVQMALVTGLGITAYQAAFNVVPARRRDQMRSLISGGPGQAGIIVTGLVLGAGSQVLRPQDLYFLGLAVGLLSTFCTWQAKRAYGGALVDALRAGQPALFVEDESFGGLQKDAAAVAVVLAGASDRDPFTRRTSVEILGQLAVSEGTAALVQALGDRDGPVRLAALRALVGARAVSSLPEVAARLADADPDVRREAINALEGLNGDPASIATQVRGLVNDPDPAVRALALQAVLRACADPSALETLATMAVADDIASRALAVEAIGGVTVMLRGDGFDLLTRGLRDPAPAVRGAATTALARTAGESSIGLLVRALGDEAELVRRRAAEALGQVGAGALEPVVRALSEPGLEDGALLALEHLPATGAAPTIRDYARKQASRALHCVDLRQRLGEASSDERRLLLESLTDEANRRGERALRAIAPLSDRSAVALALDGLKSRDPAQRAYALEVLDSLGERALIRPLLRVWETPARTVQAGASLGEALRDPDPWIRACAALVAGVSHEPTQRSALAQLAASDADALARETAATALGAPATGGADGQADGGVAMDTLAAVSLMERVVFLRRVPLFANLAPIEVKQVAAVADERVFADGEVLSSQGDPGDEMYIIVTGEVRVVVQRTDGATVEAVRRGVGEYVGEMAILTQESRIATLIAVGSVRALVIGQKAFERILRERPETGLAVIRELCARLRESETRAAQPVDALPTRVLPRFTV
jgi:AAA family ATP:ADP antiporter